MQGRQQGSRPVFRPPPLAIAASGSAVKSIGSPPPSPSLTFPLRPQRSLEFTAGTVVSAAAVQAANPDAQEVTDVEIEGDTMLDEQEIVSLRKELAWVKRELALVQKESKQGAVSVDGSRPSAIIDHHSVRLNCSRA